MAVVFVACIININYNMDKAKRPAWEKFINFLEKLYEIEMNNEQH